jgi:hypothetical protein
MLKTESIAKNSNPNHRCYVLIEVQRWARLSLSGKETWGAIFPNGKIPIESISTQKIVFETFADPKSVMEIDCTQLSEIQRETILQQLNQHGKTSFGAALGDLLKFGLPIPRNHIDCCGIKEWNYLC